MPPWTYVLLTQSLGNPQTDHIFGLIQILTHLNQMFSCLIAWFWQKMWTIWQFPDGWIGKCSLDYSKAIRKFVVLLVWVLARAGGRNSGLYILFNWCFCFQFKQERNLANFSKRMPRVISKRRTNSRKNPDKFQHVTFRRFKCLTLSTLWMSLWVVWNDFERRIYVYVYREVRFQASGAMRSSFITSRGEGGVICQRN